MWYHNDYVGSHCLENSPGTDKPTEDRQLLSTEGREQGQATPLASPHANGSQGLYNDCKGPWPSYPECAGKMEVTKPLIASSKKQFVSLLHSLPPPSLPPPPSFTPSTPPSQWMALNWKVDECYAHSGVDGTNCSFQRYLSEVSYRHRGS